MNDFVPFGLTQKKLKSHKSQRINIEGSAAAHNCCHPKSMVFSGRERDQKKKKEKAKGYIEGTAAPPNYSHPNSKSCFLS